jgi:hypothetical protein
MFFKSLLKHFKGCGSGFTELDENFYAQTLLNFAIHRRQNETRSRKRILLKTICVNSAVSRGKLAATGLWKSDYGLPSHLLSPRQLQL